MPFRKQFKSKEEYNAWFREYRKRNAEKIRKYKRKYNKEWRKKFGYASEERSKKKYPEKEHARQLLNAAVRSGRIKRGNCQTCGKPKGQGHHDDYMKPLEVKWFCPLHHREYEDCIKKLSTTPL